MVSSTTNNRLFADDRQIIGEISRNSESLKFYPRLWLARIQLCASGIAGAWRRLKLIFYSARTFSLQTKHLAGVVQRENRGSTRPGPITPLEVQASTALPVHRKRQAKPKAPKWYSLLQEKDQLPGPVRLPSIQQLLDAPTTTIARRKTPSRPLAPPSPGHSVRSQYSLAQTPVPLPSHYEPEVGMLAPVDTGLVVAPSSPTIPISRPPSCDRSGSQHHSSVAPADSGLVRYPQRSRFYRFGRDESNDDGGGGEDASALGDDVEVGGDDDMQAGDDDDMQVGASRDPSAPVDFGGGLDEDDQDDAYNEDRPYNSNEADECNNHGREKHNPRLSSNGVSYEVHSNISC